MRPFPPPCRFSGLGVLCWLLLLTACTEDRTPPRIFANPPGRPRAPRSLVIDVAAADAPCVFSRGFGHAEPWRWSLGASSRLDFEFSPDEWPMVLETQVRAAEGDSPQVVDVVFNGNAVGVLRPSAREELLRLALPPSALRAGHNVLELRYRWTRRASEVDSRDIAVAYRTIALVPAPDRQSVVVGSPEARAALASGYSREERDTERSFAWSDGPRSTLKLTLMPGPGRYVLRLKGLAIASDLAIDVLIAGRSAGAVTPGAGWTEASVGIAAGALHAGENEITLVYSKTVRPSRVDPKSTDTRELGFALASVTLAPAEE